MRSKYEKKLQHRASEVPGAPFSVRSRGFILATVVVYGAIFLMVGLGLAGYLLQMQRAEETRITQERAFTIAEAGLNYYAWHLAHFPTDLKDGTSAAGPYTHQYQDPEGGAAGSYALSINGNLQCGQPTSIDITSTGSTADDPTHTATIFGRYAKESVASYSYIVNAAVWAGANRVISGRYHSNGGVRMDSDNQSTVESSVSSWTCTSDFGCSTNTTKPGVFGSGSTPALWQYPAAQIDFGSITVNLSVLKTAAQTGGGIYFAPASGAQTSRGYHLTFKSNGTVDVSRVKSTTAVWGYSDAKGTAQEYNIIASQTFLGNYTIPSACSVIFVEDRVWVDGVVKGKVTVAAADLTGSGYLPDAILPGNISYAANDGTNGLTVVAAGNVLIPLNSPDNMSIQGIFIAQNGYYGRNYYYYQSGDPNSVPSAYSSYVTRASLSTIGTIVSNGRTGTSWICGGTTICSGYLSRTDSYDGTLASAPPPFTPYTSSQYSFVLWRQK